MQSSTNNNDFLYYAPLPITVPLTTTAPPPIAAPLTSTDPPQIAASLTFAPTTTLAAPFSTIPQSSQAAPSSNVQPSIPTAPRQIPQQRRHSSRLDKSSTNNQPRRSSRLHHNYVMTHRATSVPTPAPADDSQTCELFRLILDSGATAHMFNTISFFLDYKVSDQPDQHQVRIATGVQIPVLGFGTLPEANIEPCTFLN